MQKKTENAHLSSLAMLQAVLQDFSGHFFSAKELTQKIIETFDTHIHIATVVSALDQLKRSNRYYVEKSERRGALNLPTKVFALILPTSL